ncbi:MAG: hypothetical protein WEH44_07630, partial [Pirellulaceae bacterium]
ADMVAFRQVAGDTAKAHELRQQRDATTEKIVSELGGRYTEEEIAGVMVTDAPNLQARWDQRGTHVQELRTRIATLHERRGACTHEMQQLAGDKRLAQTQWELATVEEQLRQSLRRWQVLSVIGQALDIVRRKYETERQPETLQEASIYLKELTLGQYVRIWMPLDRRALLAADASGKSLPLDVLSRGTHEAMYISLRLALASSFARRGALLPLVFDDVLVNLDRSRVIAAARVFKEFAEGGKQILMFTCHEHIVEIFREADIEVRLIPERNQKAAAEPEKPKRKRKEPPKAPVVELPPPPPPPIVPDEAPAEPRYVVDPNGLFSQAAEEEQTFDPTNAYELARPVKPAKRRPSPPRYQIVTNYRLPESWPLAELPQQPQPPPQYQVVSFRYLPDQWPLAPPPQRQAAAPPPPAPPPPTVAPPPPVPIVSAPPKIVVPKRRQRFTWESPEMYWDDEQVAQHVEDDKGAPPQIVPQPHFPVGTAKPASRAIDVEEYPQGWHF